MIERKYLAHFIDASFGGTTANYVRLGSDLEELNEELSPNITTINNILGETRVRNTGYTTTTAVSPFFAEYDDALTEKIWDIVNKRLTGDECRTTAVDVLLRPPVTEGGTPTVVHAYKRDVYISVDTSGGNTDGVQVPFTMNDEGTPVRVNFNMSTNTVTPFTS